MSRAGRAVMVALAAVVATATTSACGSGGSGGGAGSSSGTTIPSTTVIANPAPATVKAGNELIPVPRLVDGVASLCRAAAQAGAAGSGSDGAPSAEAAAATFFDGAHEAMHELARAVEQSDRVSAARLLEAKQAVEADLSNHAAAPALAADLSHLFDAAAAGLGRLAIPAPPCQK